MPIVSAVVVNVVPPMPRGVPENRYTVSVEPAAVAAYSVAVDDSERAGISHRTPGWRANTSIWAVVPATTSDFCTTMYPSPR